MLADATNYAHATQSPAAWTSVADTYSVVYWLAARHGWTHLAELAVMKQRLAAERAHSIAATVAARDEAGAFLNSGDFGGGPAIADRAIDEAESALEGRDHVFGLTTCTFAGLRWPVGSKTKAQPRSTSERRGGQPRSTARTPTNTAPTPSQRSLALREYALGLGAVDQLAAGEPLWRIHEAVFAVLALESEPVDPRL